MAHSPSLSAASSVDPALVSKLAALVPPVPVGHRQLDPYRKTIFEAVDRKVALTQIHETLVSHPGLEHLLFRTFYAWLRRCPEYKPQGRRKVVVPSPLEGLPEGQSVEELPEGG
jgi:hypothetical protein